MKLLTLALTKSLWMNTCTKLTRYQKMLVTIDPTKVVTQNVFIGGPVILAFWIPDGSVRE